MFIVVFSSTVIISAALLLPNRPLISESYTNNAKVEQTIVLKNKGTALLFTGKYNDSITYFDKVLSINPNDVGALAGKGQALARVGKYNDSITYFDKVLSINPKSIIALSSKAQALAKLGKYNDSITFLDKTLAINPKLSFVIREKEFFVSKVLHKANSTNTNSR